MSVIQVSAGEAFSDKSGSSNNTCNVFPITPSASIIQNRISDPISGVMIIGKSDTKIVGPLNNFGKAFTPSAIASPKRMIRGVQTKV